MKKGKLLAQYPEYQSWKNLKPRCLNPNHHNFKYYGGRGIKLCDRWMSFENFLEDMGPRPSGTTIDRINPEADYEKSNCRWVTRLEQTSNRRCSIKVQTADGRTITLKQFANENGILYQTALYRMKHNRPLLIRDPRGRRPKGQ